MAILDSRGYAALTAPQSGSSHNFYLIQCEKTASIYLSISRTIEKNILANHKLCIYTDTKQLRQIFLFARAKANKF